MARAPLTNGQATLWLMHSDERESFPPFFPERTDPSSPHRLLLRLTILTCTFVLLITLPHICFPTRSRARETFPPLVALHRPGSANLLISNCRAVPRLISGQFGFTICDRVAQQSLATAYLFVSVDPARIAQTVQSPSLTSGVCFFSSHYPLIH